MARRSSLALLFALLVTDISGAQSLHERIDAAIRAGYAGPVAAPTSDVEFLRRITLDFTGVIPSIQETRQFLADKSADKRTKLVDKVLASPDFPRRMQEFFHIMFEERRTNPDSPLAAWEEYLLKSFADNKPFDQLVREILSADPDDPQLKPAARFYFDRGGDLDAITKDVGRLFLGRDIECSRCHDHPTVKDYKQADYYGLYAFLNRSFVFKKGKEAILAEKARSGKVDFESVFTMVKMQTGPHLPGGKDVEEPTFAKGQEYYVAPDPKKGEPGKPKYRPRAVLATKLTETARSSPFVRNSANRLWFMLMGRGVVHPLDQHHSGNPPSNAKLLDVLAEGLVACKFDVRAFFKEIALSGAYQRSSLLPAGQTEVPEGSFAVAELRPLSPEQLLYSVARATGVFDYQIAEAEKKLHKEDAPNFDTRRQDPLWRAKAIRAGYVNPLPAIVTAFGSRAGEAETEFQPSLAGSLFLSNDRLIVGWLNSKGPETKLIARLEKMTKSDDIAAELYLSVLTRLPTAEERAEVDAYLRRRGAVRTMALQELAWALLASTEFRMNH
jgi:hypothetical protein